MDTVESLLKQIRDINMGNQDRSELLKNIQILEESIHSFVGNKSQIETNEKNVKEKIETLKKEWERNQSVIMGNLWEKTQRLVEEEEDVWDNDKCPKVWSKAWEYGHSAGHYEVVNYFRDLCELIK